MKAKSVIVTGAGIGGITAMDSGHLASERIRDGPS
jgi:hypothetical protein